MFTRSLLSLAALAALTIGASATERRFTYVYETTTAPKGSIELENWATWKHRSARGVEDDNVFQFRHELEYGVTDQLQLGLYLSDWEYDDNDSEAHRPRWNGAGVEAIYSLTNPTTDWLGSAVYLEAIIGEDAFELEGKLLLQKNFGPLRVAYNAVIEAAWRKDDATSQDGEFAQTFGVSYDLTKRFSVGAELLHEIDLPGWRTAGDSIVFGGPNVSVRFGRAFVTATALFQMTDVEDEPDVQVRLITGFEF